MIHKCSIIILSCLILSACHDETISSRQNGTILYVPHSTSEHPVKYSYGHYTANPVQQVETHYGPHRPGFFSDTSPNITEMPEHVEVHHYLTSNKMIVGKKRHHHMPGTPLNRPH